MNTKPFYTQDIEVGMIRFVIVPGRCLGAHVTFRHFCTPLATYIHPNGNIGGVAAILEEAAA